jgi:putative ABC transport system permease protein
VPWLALGGVALIAVGGGLIYVAGRALATSYAGLFAVFLGLALLVPGASIVLMRVVERPIAAALGPTGRLAARGVVGSLSRTGVAMSALAIAVAATVGVSVMVESFRDTVARWLTTSLQADLYVASPSLVGNRPDATLPPELVARLRSVAGVGAVGTSRVTRVEIDGAPVTLVAIDPPRAALRAFRFADGGADRAWQAFRDGQVFISEPFAYRRGRQAGDRLRVRSQGGLTDVAVAAVVRDYGSSEGLVLMSRATYDRLWEDRAISSMAVYAAPGADVDGLARALRTAAGDMDVVVRPSGRIREDSLAIFDRTFAVTSVLSVLVTAVAFVGVLSALMALELERAREVATLRAQGVTPGEVWRLVITQTGLLGLVSGLAAVPIGLALAWLLVFVINRRAFGWTLDFAVEPATLIQAVALAVGAALMAGLYPAWRLARSPLASALRHE